MRGELYFSISVCSKFPHLFCRVNKLVEVIAQEIAHCGPIPFARFMELALYAPGLGYYERQFDQIGRSGDFYTSVSVGALFGELLAFQFMRWLAPLSQTNSVQIVEAGAHGGQLARDILTALKRGGAPLD